MNKNTIIKKRLKTINKIIIVALIVILGKIVYMTTIKNSHYLELANQKTYKQIMVQAPRGEIKDRNGVLLAGNKPEFTVQIVADTFNKVGKSEKEGPNRIAYSIINILERNDEEYTDEFPIVIENGKYYFTFDKKIEEFKSENGIAKNFSPKKCFYYMVDSLIDNGVLSASDRNMEPLELQSKMNSLGYYPPILVSEWMFTQQKNKNDWLESYKLDENISAKKAFDLIRNKYYKIDVSMSDSEARKIMLVRDTLKSNVYTQYNPVTLAKGIKKETVAQIEENAMKLPGVSVAVEQKRVYPETDLASHVLGYVGKIPSSKAQDLKKDGYNPDDLIGLSGIEHSYEKRLKGKSGYKEVKVDSVGRVIDEMKSVSPISGSSVYLTIDSKVQKVAESSLEKAIDSARTGSVFESQFGNISIGEYAPNAKSGALVAIDVKTGEVLSMASYPDYDPNKFAGGISAEDYNSYLPKNPNDFLAPNPLLNLATQGAFQPGSTFKLITAMAALDSGLDPGYTINDPGVIRFAGRNFADYIWHHGGKNHGIENLYKAIQESCNIYFYIIGSDKNWVTGEDLNLGMGAKKILDYAKKFGLNEGTGLENQLEERNGKVPSENEKVEGTKAQLRVALDRKMRDHFEGIDYDKDKERFDEKINEIVSWIDEDKTPGRKETMERLGKLSVKEEYIEKDADLMVYSYFNFAKWGIGDTFNLAIGQGENAYNPSQVARYIAAIANGGYLVDMNVVDKVESPKGEVTEKRKKKSEKIKFKDDNNLEVLKDGMVRVSKVGLARRAFSDFPVTVASKTGTAEKSGKIPSDNEYDYLMSHIASYGVEKKELLARYRELRSERELELTNEKIQELKSKIKNPKTEKEDREKYEKELERGIKVKLDDNDKINAFYLRKAIKSLNAKISDTDIDRFKPDYGSFAWCVAFAPAENPEIAVACVIPQGESSSYAILPIREVMGQYFGLIKEEDDEKEEDKLDQDKKEQGDEEESKSQENKNEESDNESSSEDRTRDINSDIKAIE